MGNSKSLLKASIFYLEGCKGTCKELVISLSVSKNPKDYNLEEISEEVITQTCRHHKTCGPPSQKKLRNKAYKVEVKEIKINENSLEVL